MKPRRRKSTDKQWCAPEHCKRDCSWKGGLLASSKYAHTSQKEMPKIDGENTEELAQLQCGKDYEHAVEFVDETLGCKRKRYLKNGIIREERR